VDGLVVVVVAVARIIRILLGIVCRLLLMWLVWTSSQALEFLGVFGLESFQGSSRGLEKGTGSLFGHVNNGSWCRRRVCCLAILGSLVLSDQLLLLSLIGLGGAIQSNQSFDLVEKEEKKGPLEHSRGSHGSLNPKIVLMVIVFFLRVHLVHDNHLCPSGHGTPFENGAPTFLSMFPPTGSFGQSGTDAGRLGGKAGIE